MTKKSVFTLYLVIICIVCYAQTTQLRDARFGDYSDRIVLENSLVRLVFNKQTGVWDSLIFLENKIPLFSGSSVQTNAIEPVIDGNEGSDQYIKVFNSCRHEVSRDSKWLKLYLNFHFVNSAQKPLYEFTETFKIPNDGSDILRQAELTKICLDGGGHASRLEGFIFKTRPIAVGNDTRLFVPGPWFPNTFVKPGSLLCDFENGRKIVFHSAPDAGFGLIVLSCLTNSMSLGTWLETDGEVNYFPEITLVNHKARIHFKNERAYYLSCGQSVQSDIQYLHLTKGTVHDVLTAFKTFNTSAFPLNATNPAWVKDLVILEAYPKYYKQGFEDIIDRLPFYRDIGFNALYLMPHWLGGYSPIDFFEVDPLYGTEAQLKALVSNAHDLGMKVFFDLVIHGFSDKSPVLKTHPELFVRDSLGNIAHHRTWRSMSTDWAKEEYLEYMSNLAEHHAREFKIDGYRLDAASFKGPEWEKGLPYPAYKSGSNALEVMHRILQSLRKYNPEAMILNEVFGPAFYTVSNLAHDNQTEAPQQFLEKMEQKELNIQDYKRHLILVREALPEGANRVFFSRNHDTSWFYHFNGYSKAFMNLEVVHAFCGIPEVFAGDRRPGVENPDDNSKTWEFYKKLFAKRKEIRDLGLRVPVLKGVENSNSSIFSMIISGNGKGRLVLVSFDDQSQHTKMDLKDASRALDQTVSLVFQDLDKNSKCTMQLNELEIQPYQVLISEEFNVQYIN